MLSAKFKLFCPEANEFRQNLDQLIYDTFCIITKPQTKCSKNIEYGGKNPLQWHQRSSMTSQNPTTQLFVQQLVQAKNIENMIAPDYWGESTNDGWFPQTASNVRSDSMS